MKKRLLSALLALVMVLAMLPVSVFAADGDATPAVVKIPVNGLTNATWTANDTVTVKAESGTITFSAVAKVTAVSGSDVTWDVTGAPTGYSAAFDGANLTLTATTAGATTLKASDFGTLTVAVSNTNDSNLTSGSTGTLGITDGQDATDSGGSTNPGTIKNPNDGVTTTAATSTHDGMTATYQRYNKEASGKTGAIVGAPGYFIAVRDTASGETNYFKVESGLIVGGKYVYSGSYTAATSSSNIIAVGGSCSITAESRATSLTIDVYGASSLTINGGNNLTTVTIKDTKYAEELNLGLRSEKNSVTLSNLWATGKSATLNMENVKTTDTISMTGNYTHTVKLTNADVGGITLDGTDSEGKKADAKQTVQVNSEGGNVVRNSTVGAINVKGNSASVSLVDATATSVTLDGTGTSLTVGGESSVASGGVTLQDHLTSKAANTTLSTVTVKGTVSGNITTSNVHAGKVKVDVQAGGSVTGNINLAGSVADNTLSADVDVTSATVGGTITVEGGTVDVANRASVSALTMSGNTKFKVTGSYNTVDDITATGSQVDMTIPADSTNQYGIVNISDYKKGNILGGMWDTAVPAAALSSKIDYQLEKPTGTFKYGYYTEDQLASALTDQGTSNGTLTCTKVGLNDTTYTMVFKNGTDVWGQMTVHGGVQIKLPTQVNTVTVTRWSDLWRSYNAGASYSTPAQSAVAGAGQNVWELNAGGGVTNGDISKFTGVSVKGGAGSAWVTPAGSEPMGTVKGTLNGTVITLTGAVPKGTSTMTLVLSTDALEEGKDAQNNKVDVPVVLNVGVTYDSAKKTLVFANVATDLGHGVTLETENGIDILRLSNGTKYTLNGSGLKEIASQIHVATSGNNYLIEASASGVSSLRTQAAKNAVVGLVNGSYGTDNQSTVFDWSGSPAMEVSINAALATITDSQVEQWRNAAQRAAWSKLNTGTFNQATHGAATGYTEVYLVPYLQVNLSNYVAGNTATATFVPSWRVEVRQPAGTDNAYSTIFYDANDPSKPANAYIAKTGTSLDQLTGEFGEVKVNFNDFFMDEDYYMHQDGTYAYKYDDTNGCYVITHAGTGSNGLGTMVISTDEPLVKRLSTKGGATEAYYDSLQAAVDDAEEGNHINVDQNYKGSTSITVSGTARKFTIQANGNNIVIANASGGLVDWNNTGSEYTVQLNRDNTAVADPNAASIAVTSVANGTAVVSATSAKAGTTITVTTTPASGYRTSSVSVSAHMTNTNTNSAVSVSRSSENVYTFKVPEGADSITVTPTFVLNTGMPFTDVAATDYYYSAVKYVYDNGLMNGVDTAGTVFGGSQTLNRAMVVTILYRAAGSPSVSSYSGFSDVASNTWYSQAVTWGSQNKIVEGDGNGTFRPTDAITRQELATILYRYNTTYKGRATTGSTTLTGYTDQGYVSNWATAGMQWAVGNGIVNGTTTTTLTPGGNATRYQAATMLMRYGQNFGL